MFWKKRRSETEYVKLQNQIKALQKDLTEIQKANERHLTEIHSRLQSIENRRPISVLVSWLQWLIPVPTAILVVYGTRLIDAFPDSDRNRTELISFLGIGALLIIGRVCYAWFKKPNDGFEWHKLIIPVASLLIPTLTIYSWFAVNEEMAADHSIRILGYVISISSIALIVIAIYSAASNRRLLDTSQQNISVLQIVFWTLLSLQSLGVMLYLITEIMSNEAGTYLWPWER